MKIDFSTIHVFNWDNLYYIELENEVGIESFKKLCDNQEASLMTTEQEFKELVTGEMKKLHPDDQSSYYMQIFERDEMIIKEILRQQRYALCLSIFSFFEGRLKALCTLIENKFNFKLKVGDLNGNEDLLRYWNYLEKVFEVEVGPLEKYYTPIRHQKAVRNLIAHQNGIPRPEQAKKINIVKGLALQALGEFQQIVIHDPIYIMDLLDRMELFLKELLLVVDERAKQIKASSDKKPAN